MEHTRTLREHGGLRSLHNFLLGHGGSEGRKAQIEAVVDVRLMLNKLRSIVKFNFRSPAPLERQLWATVRAIFKNWG
jgi:hypothetical protein